MRTCWRACQFRRTMSLELLNAPRTCCAMNLVEHDGAQHQAVGGARSVDPKMCRETASQSPESDEGECHWYHLTWRSPMLRSRTLSLGSAVAAVPISELSASPFLDTSWATPPPPPHFEAMFLTHVLDPHVRNPSQVCLTCRACANKASLDQIRQFSGGPASRDSARCRPGSCRWSASPRTCCRKTSCPTASPPSPSRGRCSPCSRRPSPSLGNGIDARRAGTQKVDRCGPGRPQVRSEGR